MKRIFDIFFSITVLSVLSPLFIVIFFTILIFQGRPILFKQYRLGKGHVKFRIIKFCTMTNDKYENGELLPDKDRTTRLGKFLRTTSLDELPGFWNVLKGEMSVVGPRPLPIRYKERFTIQQDRRHEIRPGVTGWAQINGRNNISWKKKFLLDIWYLDNQSFLLDLQIIFLTIYKVILRRNITPENKNSVKDFLGD